MPTAESFLDEVENAAAAPSATAFLDEADTLSATGFLDTEEGSSEPLAPSNPADIQLDPVTANLTPDMPGIADDAVNIQNALARGTLNAGQALFATGVTNAATASAEAQSANKALADFDAMNATPDRQAFLNSNPIAKAEAERQRNTLVGRLAQFGGEAAFRQQQVPSSLRRIAEFEQAKQEIPATGGYQEFQQGDWKKALFENPVEVVAGLIAESAPLMAPALAASLVAGPGAGASIAGASSYSTESALGILDSLQKQGANPADPASLEKFFSDPEKLATARDYAVKRGVPIAIFDAATAGLAGRIVGPTLGRGAGRVIAGSAGEVAMQAAGGAGGEAIAQLASTGRIESVRDIVAEAIAEVGSGVPEAIGNLRAQSPVQSEAMAREGGTPEVAASAPTAESFLDETPAEAAPAPTAAAEFDATVQEVQQAQEQRVAEAEALTTQADDVEAAGATQTADALRQRAEAQAVPEVSEQDAPEYALLEVLRRRAPEAAAVEQAAIQPEVTQPVLETPNQPPLASKTPANPAIAEGQPVYTEDQQTHVQRITERVDALKQTVAGVQVNVVRNASELPERIRSQIDPRATYEGMVDTGTGDVFILADNITDPARAAEVFAHEVVGHYGVERLVGEQEWQRIADSIFTRDPEVVSDIARLYTRGNVTRLGTQERAMVAREYVARLAEQPSLNPALWRRIVQAVRNALRKLGVVRQWSESDIRDLLRRSARAVQAPAGPVPGGGVRGAVRDFGPDVIANSPLAEQIEQAFEAMLPEQTDRTAVGAYVEAVMNGGQPEALQGSLQEAADAFVAYFNTKQEYARRNGVLEKATGLMSEQLQQRPEATLPERLAVFSSAVNRMVQERQQQATSLSPDPTTPTESPTLPSIPAVGMTPVPEPGSPVEGGRPGEYYTRVAESDRGNLGQRAWEAVRRSTTVPDSFRADMDFAAERLLDIGDLQQALDYVRSGGEPMDGLTERRRIAMLFVIQQQASAQRLRATNPIEAERLGQIEENAALAYADLATQGGKNLNIVSQLANLTPMTPEGRVRVAEQLVARSTGAKAADGQAERVRAELQAAEQEAVAGAVSEVLNPPEPKAPTAAQRIRQKLKAAASEARKRIAERRTQFGSNPFLDPTAIYDHSLVAADLILEGANTLAKLTSRMVKEFGEYVKPHMADIYAQAREIVAESRRPDSGGFSVTQRERNDAIDMVRRLASPSGQASQSPRQRAALEEFFNRVKRDLRANWSRVNAQERERLNDDQLISRAVADMKEDRYSEAAGIWEQAMNQELATASDERKAILREYLDAGMRDAFMENARRAVQAEIRRSQTDVRALATQSLRNRAQFAQDFAQRLVQRFPDLGTRQAERFAAAFEKVFTQRVEKAGESILKNRLQALDTPRKRALKKTNTQRLLELFRLGALNSDEFSRIFREEAGVKTLAPENRERLRQLYTEAEALPEGSIRNRKLNDIAWELAFMERRFDLWDYAQGVSYGNILGAFSTLIANNPIGALSTTLETLVTLPFANKQQRWATAAGGLRAWATSFGDALNLATNALMTGDNFQNIHQFDAAMQQSPMEYLAKLAENPAANLPTRWTAKVVSQYRWVNRIMMASDAFFRWPAQQAIQFTMAADIAAQRGLNGQSLWDAVDELLYPGGREQAVAEAGQQVAEETAQGLHTTRAQQFTRRLELLNQKLSPEGQSSLAESAGLADYASLLNDPPEDLIGMAHAFLVRLVNPARDANRGTKIVAGVLSPFVRFVRTAANATRIVLDYSVGYGALSYFTRQAPLLEGRAGEAQQRQRLIRGMIGLAFYASLLTYFAGVDDDDDPWFDVIGKGPEDWRERKRLRDSGMTFFSLKFGNTYIAYRNSPLLGIFGAFGRYRDNKKWPKGEQTVKGEPREEEEALMAGAMGVLEAIGNQSFTRGLSDFLAMMNGQKTGFGQTAGEFVGNVAATYIPFNLRGLSQIDELLNGPKERADGFLNSLQNGIAFVAPNGRSVTLLGDEVVDVKNKALRFAERTYGFSTLAEDDTLAFVIQNGLAVPTIGNVRGRDGRRLTHEQFTDYMQRSGERMRRWLELEGGMNRLNRLPETGTRRDRKGVTRSTKPRQEELNKKWKEFRDAALRQVSR